MRPVWEVATGQYFYRVPVEHILCGFVYEGIRYSGAYVWRYAFPLYEPADFIHLSFGDRLPHPEGFIAWDPDADPTTEAAEFVRRVAPYEAETYSWGTLSGFLTLLELRRDSDDHRLNRTRAMTLVMLGRYEEAESELNDIAERTDLHQMPQMFVEQLEELRIDLSRDTDLALARLKGWEADARTRFRIVT